MKTSPTLAMLLLLLAACTPRGPIESGSGADTTPIIELRIVHEEPGVGRDPVLFEDDTLYLDPPVISDADFLSVRPEMRENGVILSLELEREAGVRFATVTRENVGRRMAFIVRGDVESVPVIQSEIGPRAQAMVEASAEEAESLARAVRSRWP